MDGKHFYSTRPENANKPVLVGIRAHTVDILTEGGQEFSKWGGIFTDDQMAAAMIDRLVHHGHLLIFEGKSYRMEHALMRRDA